MSNDYCGWPVLLINVLWYSGIAFGLGYWLRSRKDNT